MTRLYLFVLFLLSVLLLGSCAKEGCTDEAAANYNITADKDDGSCVYCSVSTEQILQTRSSNIIDTRFSSEYANQVVLNITLQVKSISFPLRNCGEEGCFLIVTATNTTSSVITNLHFDLPVSIINIGTNSFDFSFPVTLDPGESHTYADVTFPLEVSGCASLSQNQFSGFILSANYD